jgi:hypothetical protein
MIDERERMMTHRSRSIDSVHERSRPTSQDRVPLRLHHAAAVDDDENNDDDDDDDAIDDDFNESDSSVTRILKRRLRKKKKQSIRQTNKDMTDDHLNFDCLRRRLSR